MRSPRTNELRVTKQVQHLGVTADDTTNFLVGEIVPNFQGVANTAVKMVRVAKVLNIPVIVTEQTPKRRSNVQRSFQPTNAMSQPQLMRITIQSSNRLYLTS